MKIQVSIFVCWHLPTNDLHQENQYSKSWNWKCHSGFPQLLKNHWNSYLLEDHGKISEFHKKNLKFVKRKKSWKISEIWKSFLEKSLIFKSDAELTKWMKNTQFILHWLIIKHYVIQIQPSAVMIRSNLSQYHLRHCDNSGRKWIRY